MRTAILTRDPGPDEDGTFGKIVTDSGFECYTIELPWRDNNNDMSCVPLGSYKCTLINSPAHGRCYTLTCVPGRTLCEIHPANLAGDISKGGVKQLLGCISMGRSIDVFAKGSKMYGINSCSDKIMMVELTRDQHGVTSSKDAVTGFMNDMAGEDFILTIKQGDFTWLK